jgi:hypothetical protein
MTLIDNLLNGSIDMHIHAGPDPRVERRADALKAASQAHDVGMRAIVLKSHEYPTAPLAYIVNQTIRPDIAIGSITLNHEVGGLNPFAVEASAKMGARVVWMPTNSSIEDMRKKNKADKGIYLLDKNGDIVPSVREILNIIKQYKLILATGHISKAETFVIVEEARKIGIQKIIITHPLQSGTGSNLTVDEQVLMAQKGATIEHTFNCTTPLRGRLDPGIMVKAIKAAAAENCILSTDFGQDFNPTPVEGMRAMIGTLLSSGCTSNEIELMVKTNPIKLLDLQDKSK